MLLLSESFDFDTVMCRNEALTATEFTSQAGGYGFVKSCVDVFCVLRNRLDFDYLSGLDLQCIENRRAVVWAQCSE